MHQIPKLNWFSFSLAVVTDQSIGTRCWFENEGVVGAALTGDAPTTSEWSTIFFAYYGVPYIRDLMVFKVVKYDNYNYDGIWHF